MAELAVRALRGQGAGSLFITNRTFERAVALARALDGIPIMLYEISDYLHSMDILISSISSEGYAIGRSEIEKTLPERGGRPLIIIDISVPRSVDPEVSGLENVHLYNIDDLTSIAEANLSSRLAEANKAEAIIKDRGRKILQKLDTDGVISDIVAMRKAAEEIRRSELEKLFLSGGLPEEQRDRLDAFSRSVVNKILHQTIEKMREHAGYMRFK
jgi:glutamyl-tRNA reductase